MLPFHLGVPELILILVILLLIFGVGRIPKITGEIGTAIREFRRGIKSPDEDHKPESKN